jgi:uncharacterized protein involved in outer membrane biogenesis
MAQQVRRRHPILILFGTLLVLLVVLVLVWDWNWFKPWVEAEASSALGRKVTIGNLDVHLAADPVIVADRIEVGDPPGFPAGSRFGSVDRLAVAVNPQALLHHTVQLTSIEVDGPHGDLKPGPDGKPNWLLTPAKSGQPASAPMTVLLGQLTVRDGTVHIVEPKLKADFVLHIETQTVQLGAGNGAEPNLVVTAKGTYNAQPITARFVGGSVLSLRQGKKPYPVFLQAANGATHVLLKGTVDDPTHFAGARLELDLKGASLADLYPLTGIPFAATAPYHLTGSLDYAPPRFRFRNIVGRVGSSDLEGEIDEDPGSARPMVTAKLRSKQVVLADLGGFIGATPGQTQTLTPAQKAEKAKKAASPNLLPDTPINLPRLRAADIDATYKADRIEGKSIPLDNIAVHLTIRDGAVTVDPLNFGVGTGTISSNIRLTPDGNRLHAVADIDFRHLDFRRIMQATGGFHGSGIIGGRARIDGTGRSLAGIVGDGNGELQLFMMGGDMSSLLVDLAGLDFGNSLLSALGLPSQTKLHCMIGDFSLENGLFKTRTMLIDTDEANVVGKGTINMRNETLDYQASTEPKHFSIGSLPAPIDINGPLKSPSIKPDPAVLAVRGGAAAVLGVLLTPLGALLPTIQLGLGKDNDCVAMIHDVRARAAAPTERANTGK